MKKIRKHHLITAALVATAAGIVATSGYLKNQNFPDQKLTPGLIRTSDISDICGHTTSIYRNTTQAMKTQVYAEYSVTSHPPGAYEIDHWYPLGIGGADDIKNLWPMPAPQFHDKDKVENELRIRLCKGEITQQQAIDDINHWTTVYNQEFNTGNLGGLSFPEDKDDEISQ